MAEPKTVNEILTKIVSVYKKDIYVLDWRYCIGGIKSEKENPGIITTILEDAEVSIFKEAYPDNPILYIENIRKYKSSNDEVFLKTNFTEEEEATLHKKKNRYVSVINKITNWEPLTLTEEQLDDLLVKKTIVLIKITDKYSFAITSGLIPLLTEKTLEGVSYTVIQDVENRGGVFLVVKFTYSLFTYYNFVYYLDIL